MAKRSPHHDPGRRYWLRNAAVGAAAILNALAALLHELNNFML